MCHADILPCIEWPFNCLSVLSGVLPGVCSKCKYEKHARWSRACAFICVSFFRLTEARLSLYYGPCIRHSRFTVAQTIVGIGANLSSKASRQILVHLNGKWYKIPFFNLSIRKVAAPLPMLTACLNMMPWWLIPWCLCHHASEITSKIFFVSLHLFPLLWHFATLNSQVLHHLKKCPIVSQPIVLLNCLNRIWQEIDFLHS